MDMVFDVLNRLKSASPTSYDEEACSQLAKLPLISSRRTKYEPLIWDCPPSPQVLKHRKIFSKLRAYEKQIKKIQPWDVLIEELNLHFWFL